MLQLVELSVCCSDEASLMGFDDGRVYFFMASNNHAGALL